MTVYTNAQIVSTTKPLPNNIIIMKQIRNVYRRNWKRYREHYDHQRMTQLNKNKYNLRNKPIHKSVLELYAINSRQIIYSFS